VGTTGRRQWQQAGRVRRGQLTVVRGEQRAAAGVVINQEGFVMDRAGGASRILQVVWRRLWVVLAIAALAGGAALALSLSQQKQYSASASLLFRDPALDQKLFGSSFIAPSSDPAREAATNVKLVSLHGIAVRTSRALKGRLSVKEIEDRVDVQSEGQADIVSVTFTDPDRDFAPEVANAFANQYIAFRREADRSKVSEAERLVETQLNSLTPTELSTAEGRSLRERSEQLKVLASLQTGNAELVQPATTPSGPSSPRPLRNTALAIIVGLVLGAGLSMLLDKVDRRLRNPKEAEEIFQRPLLGVIPEVQTKRKSGAAAMVLAPRDAEAFQMLRANLRYFNVSRDMRSLLITSAASGEGKSTVAWNLSVAAARSGLKTLLIETDLRRPTLGQRFESRGFGLSHLLTRNLPLEEVVEEVDVSTSSDYDHRRVLDVVVSGALPPNPTDLVESQRMREVIHEAEETYDLVVLDTPPTTVVPDAIPLVSAVSGVIAVMRLGSSTTHAAQQLSTQLNLLNAPVLGVVVNYVKDRTSYGYGYGYGYASAAQRPPSRDDGPGEFVEPVPVATGGNPRSSDATTRASGSSSAEEARTSNGAERSSSRYSSRSPEGKRGFWDRLTRGSDSRY
jgi:capsular exopolysaccharide synthesis family protein